MNPITPPTVTEDGETPPIPGVIGQPIVAEPPTVALPQVSNPAEAPAPTAVSESPAPPATSSLVLVIEAMPGLLPLDALDPIQVTAPATASPTLAAGATTANSASGAGGETRQRATNLLSGAGEASSTTDFWPWLLQEVPGSVAPSSSEEPDRFWPWLWETPEKDAALSCGRVGTEWFTEEIGAASAESRGQAVDQLFAEITEESTDLALDAESSEGTWAWGVVGVVAGMQWLATSRSSTRKRPWLPRKG